MIEDPTVLSRIVLCRSAIIFGLAAVPLLVLQEFRLLLGLFAGTVLALVNFSLLKLPFSFLLGLPSSGSRPTKVVLPIVLSLVRFALVAVGIFFLIRWRLLNVVGIFLGVTVPLIAISSLLVFKWSWKWKV